MNTQQTQEPKCSNCIYFEEQLTIESAHGTCTNIKSSMCNNLTHFNAMCSEIVVWDKEKQFNISATK